MLTDCDRGIVARVEFRSHHLQGRAGEGDVVLVAGDAFDDVAGADEARDEFRLRAIVDVLRRADLGDQPLVHHCDAVGHHQRFLLIVRHVDERDPELPVERRQLALHLAPQCESVEAVDSSETALRAAHLNYQTNPIGNINFREADAFELLAGYASAHKRFDTVVLDPPAFAKSRQNLEAAVRGYREINRRALELLGSGGVLVTCSCSHHLSEATLLEIVAAASLDTGRKLRVLERRMQSQDHPVLLTVPETLYLKCLILEVV